MVDSIVISKTDCTEWPLSRGLSLFALPGISYTNPIRMLRTIARLSRAQLKDKIVLLRLDFNTADSWRMEASLPTLKTLRKNAKAVVILSHRGRPDGFDKVLSLKPEARRLQQLIKTPVKFLSTFAFSEIAMQIRKARQGSVFLLENLRFLPGEETNDPALAKDLASLGNIYVNDAFAVSHRSHASVVGITRHLPSYAGLELAEEVTSLSHALNKAKRPLLMILGGAKIDKKKAIIDRLRSRVDTFLIGGLVNDQILALANDQIITPVDLINDSDGVKDIGSETIKIFKAKIAEARSIIWNGPVGDIELPRFQKGTQAIARAIVANRKAFLVIGGGETVMFLKKMRLLKHADFVSTGGGAMLDFLAGKLLPGIAVLET